MQHNEVLGGLLMEAGMGIFLYANEEARMSTNFVAMDEDRKTS